MNWVKCSDQMPDQPQDITEVKRYWCALESGYCDLIKWAFTTSGYHEFIWNEEITSPIKYWCKLPEPTKEDE